MEDIKQNLQSKLFTWQNSVNGVESDDLPLSISAIETLRTEMANSGDLEPKSLFIPKTVVPIVLFISLLITGAIFVFENTFSNNPVPISISDQPISEIIEPLNDLQITSETDTKSETEQLLESTETEEVPSSTKNQNKVTDPKNAKCEGKVNLNLADISQLQTLKGVGPSTAKKIIDYRDESGGFSTIQDLMDVKGIGEKKFQNVEKLVCV